MLSARSVIILTVLIVLAGIFQSESNALAAVVVSPAAFATTEGSDVVIPTSAYPGGAAFANGARLQQFFSAADFTATGPLEIRQVAFRPDGSVNQPVTTTWNLEVILSTSTRTSDTLDLLFAANHGANVQTVKSLGPITLQTDGMRETGQPHNFDYTINLDTPFLYDPQQGNLMLELRWQGQVDPAWLDSNDFNDGNSRTLFAQGFNTGIANFAN